MQASAIEAILGLSGRLIWLSLLHATWLGLLAAAAVAIAFQARPSLSHKARHNTSLVALMLIPLVAPGFVILQHAAGPRPRSQPSIIAARPAWTVVEDRFSTRVIIHANAPPSNHFETRVRISSIADRVASLVRQARLFIMTVWSLGTIGMACILAVSFAAAVRWRRSSRPADDPIQARARRLGRRLGLAHVPAIGIHPTLAEPCLCGGIRPVVLLPDRWLAEAPPEAIDAVLAHELAHARRADHLINFGQRIIEMLLFFHPAVHWLSRSLRRHREFCTDALAVRLTGNPLALARALESVALSRPDRPEIRPFGASLGCEASSLSLRIQELIGMMPALPRKRLWPYAAVPFALAFAGVAVTAGAWQEQASTPLKPSQAANAHVSEAIRKLAAQTFDTPDDGDGISYKLRYFDIDARTWQRREGKSNGLVGEGRGSQGWVINQDEYLEILELLVGDPSTRGLLAPKVTASDGDSANIEIGPPVAESIRLTGNFVPQGIQLTVDVVSSFRPLSGAIKLSGMPSDQESEKVQIRLRKFREGNSPGSNSGAHQGGAESRARYQGTTTLPKGSKLIVSLGNFDREVDGRKVSSKRLIFVTPERAPAPKYVSDRPARG